MTEQKHTGPTGEQFTLCHDGPLGPVSAVVTELAAALRSLRVGGVALVQEYAAELGPPPGAAGIVLVPWPNRVAGARWILDGVEQRLDVTEPKTGNASHGLLRNTGYAVLERSASTITLGATVFPQHGYPFHLKTSVRYALVEDGLWVTHTVVNHSAARAPVAVGAHPYLCVGDTPVEELVVTVAASSYCVTDDRGIPLDDRPVHGTPLDLRHGARLGDLELDTAYTGLCSEDGEHRHRLRGPAGDGVELWADAAFGYVQVFTNWKFPGDDGVRLAVAVEPMTAPADALNSGAGLRWLQSGESWSVSWGLRRLLPRG
jgi:aldose 1-epimerase